MENPAEGDYPKATDESKRRMLDELKYLHDHGLLRPAPQPSAPPEEDEDATWPSGPWDDGDLEDDEAAPAVGDEG